MLRTTSPPVKQGLRSGPGVGSQVGTVEWRMLRADGLPSPAAPVSERAPAESAERFPPKGSARPIRRPPSTGGLPCTVCP